MAKESEHHAKTTEYIDHGAKDHDDQVQWDKDDKGKLTQEKEHVEKGTGGQVTQDKSRN
jgi:hypothetical protein